MFATLKSSNISFTFEWYLWHYIIPATDFYPKSSATAVTFIMFKIEPDIQMIEPEIEVSGQIY